MKLLFEIFICFAKIGLFTFGGGHAMISLIEHECVERRKWISYDEMLNITVIAESTPGPIAINCATYVGFKLCGLVGAIIGTVGIVLPSFAVIYIISIFLDGFLEIKIIAGAFMGLKLGAALLIINAAINMLKKMPKKKMPLIVMLSAFIIMSLSNFLSLRLSSISLMLAAACIGLLVSISGYDNRHTKGEGSR